MLLCQTDVPSPAMQVCEDGSPKVRAREPRRRREAVEQREALSRSLPLGERDCAIELVKH
jgi:hypothetical protein